MDWIIIAIVSGTISTAGFPNREACEGKVFTLKEQKIEAKCVEAPHGALYLNMGINYFCYFKRRTILYYNLHRLLFPRC